MFFLRIETKWFIIIVLIGGGGIAMKTSDMIRQLCEQMNISVSELASMINLLIQQWGLEQLQYS